MTVLFYTILNRASHGRKYLMLLPIVQTILCSRELVSDYSYPLFPNGDLPSLPTIASVNKYLTYHLSIRQSGVSIHLSYGKPATV